MVQFHTVTVLLRRFVVCRVVFFPGQQPVQYVPTAPPSLCSSPWLVADHVKQRMIFRMIARWGQVLLACVHLKCVLVPCNAYRLQRRVDMSTAYVSQSKLNTVVFCTPATHQHHKDGAEGIVMHTSAKTVVRDCKA
eukprot:jgi/Ulvmu1/364/UM001_0371.1